MKASDLFGQHIEPIPGLPYTREVAEVCEHRAKMLTGMAQHRGYKVIERLWRQWRAEGRMLAQAEPDPKEWRRIVANVNALAAVEDIIGEYAALATFLKANAQAERKPMARPDFTDATAAQAIQDAELVKEMAKLPGTALFFRDIGARVRALASLLTMCSETERSVINGVIGALTTALMAPMQILDLGMDAEMWQQARLEELARKGKE